MKRKGTGRIMAAAALVFLLVAGFGCQGTDSPTRPPAGNSPVLSFLALGDSYTVGHSLPPAWSWPHQLADSLAASGDTLLDFDVVAQTGWTTADLLAATGEADLQPGYGLVTVMIGVNDQYQGLDIDGFAARLDTLLARAEELGETVIVFTIPDYGVTPAGQLFGGPAISREIDVWNGVLREVAAGRGLVPLNVTALSREAADDPTLVSRDGLHYSREMYGRWVDLMLPAVRRALGLE
jgi:lysophospholipase L1-like esterase